MLLGDKNPSTLWDISRCSLTKFSTIMRKLPRMENEDLINPKPFPDDNRVIEVLITETGKNILYELKISAIEI